MDEIGTRRGTVRDVTPADLPGLKAVIAACGLFPPDMLDAMIGPHLSGDAPAELWLTVADPVPAAVGYCAPERMTAGTWNMLLVAVHPARQGRGLGAAVMREAETRLGARGERLLLVETSGLAGFSGPRAFYRRVGYHEEACIRDFYAAGEDKVVFRKALARGFRLAGEADVPALQAVELDAARAYAASPATRFCLGLPPRSAAEHRAARDGGMACVAEVNGVAAGFFLAVPQDGRAHLLEVAVRRDHQGLGLGRALVDAFESWAAARGFPEATLTTFRDVPWNAPFYARLGYRAIDVGRDRGGLSALVEEERRAGVHGAPRVAMSKRLAAR